MVAVTVTGGSTAKQPIVLQFAAGRDATEAKSIAGMISGSYSGQPATYISTTQNPGGLNSGAGYSPYLVVTTPTGTATNPTDVHLFDAITFDAAATVFGGAPSGQTVLAGSAGLTYSTTYSNGLIQVAGGDNAISFIGSSGNTVYGGSGSDTIAISGGVDTVFAGNGATLVLLSGSTVPGAVTGVSVSGGQLASSTLQVDGANFASTVDGGLGTLVAYDAVGSYTGGANGKNTIIGGTGGPVTITGGGVDDLLTSSSASSVITTADVGATVDLYSGGDTVNSSFDGANINLNIGTGNADTVNLGFGDTTVQVASGSVSLNGGSGNLTFFGGPDASTVDGGTGTVTAYVNAGSITGGSGGPNAIVGTGPGNETLTGGANGDYIQAGTGNVSLVAGTGAESLIAGSGADTLVATTDQASTTLISFAGVSGVAGASYEIDNFLVSPTNTIYTANQTDANYILSSEHVVGGNIEAMLNSSTNITLKGDTTLLTSTQVKPL